MEVDRITTECTHSKRCSRERFYRTLFAHSTDPDGYQSFEGSNEPINDVEKSMMKKWMVICPTATVYRLRSLPVDNASGRKQLKDAHRLSLFSRDKKVTDPLAYISSHRVLSYDCDCNDTRCICGEESSLLYIYNTKTHFVLTVGTTCAKTVKMSSIDYKRCCECNTPIHSYTMKNLGRCNECAKNTKLTSGLRAGQEVTSVAKDFSYIPTLDVTLSFVDTVRIMMVREKLCTNCKEHIDRGIRGEGVLGWKDGGLCAGCVLRGKPTLETHEDAVTTALTDPYGPFVKALASNTRVSDRDTLLLAYIHSLFQSSYFATGSMPVGFGKYSLMSRREMVEKHSAYISWCRDKCDSPSPQMCALVAYADLHERYVSVTGWPE